jgi:hypothetical protein
MAHTWSARASRAVNLVLTSRAFWGNCPFGQRLDKGNREAEPLLPALGCEGHGSRDLAPQELRS